MEFQSSFLSDDNDIAVLRAMLSATGNELDALDFEELMALEPIRARTRLWRSADEQIVAFAFVDNFNNLCFSIDPEVREEELGAQIVEWGEVYMRGRNQESGLKETLDASCDCGNSDRIRFLEQHGFNRTDLRTLKYARSLEVSIPEVQLPAGFMIRSVLGEWEVEQLVELHRAAFGTNYMTTDYRLAMMRTASYDPELDLVLVAPGEKLAAFCICGIEVGENEPSEQKVGFTDPIGVHPQYQKRGLGKAILLTGLRALRQRGVERVGLGTSSENIPMQRLAESAGFQLEKEKYWYSKEVD
jgi:ribosomal protein S18 acetylase RimI-like enzyme